MEHKHMKIIGVFLIISVVTISILYDYYTLTHASLDIRMGLKVTPVICNMVYIAIYFLIYRVTIYSAFMLGALFLCMLGDIFIVLYDPAVENAMDNKMLYFIVGGAFFFVARLLFIVIFALKPYSRISIIRHHRGRVILSHILFTLPFLILAILNLALSRYFIDVDAQAYISFPTVAVSLYLFLGFGLPMSYAFLRIGALENCEVMESFYSCYFGFVGITIFNVSDILLLMCMYTALLPSFCFLISINLYWLALLFLTLSIIRTPFTSTEKGEFALPIMQQF